MCQCAMSCKSQIKHLLFIRLMDLVNYIHISYSYKISLFYIAHNHASTLVEINLCKFDSLLFTRRQNPLISHKYWNWTQNSCLIFEEKIGRLLAPSFTFTFIGRSLTKVLAAHSMSVHPRSDHPNPNPIYPSHFACCSHPT